MIDDHTLDIVEMRARMQGRMCFHCTGTGAIKAARFSEDTVDCPKCTGTGEVPDPDEQMIAVVAEVRRLRAALVGIAGLKEWCGAKGCEDCGGAVAEQSRELARAALEGK